ncbi:MAG: ABC transporter substrate-binding protein [Chloroflexi bacterium]|nr:ABC transporter substrate-binding protein [Chloroflexota bacterium]
MKGWYKILTTVVSCFVVLALLSTLVIGCGKKNGEEVTIVIGNLTDVTGPAASALMDITRSLDDLVRYTNEEDPIPGVKLRVVTFDTRYDPSRDIPGYDWCRDKGAKLIITPLPTTGESVKAFSDRDKIPLCTAAATAPMLQTPGWTFCFNSPAMYQVNAMLKWVSDQWPNYPTKPKIGSAGWYEPYMVEVTKAAKEYCQAHPDKFDYVAGFLVPMGQSTWSGEIPALKDCDYILPPATGIGTATFIRDYRSRGHAANFIGLDALCAFKGLVVDLVGWPGLDGTVSGHGATLWWNQSYPRVELAIEILRKYHAGEADAILRSSPQGYIGGIQQQGYTIDIVRKAVEAVGAANFDSQAFYDAAISYELDWEGYPSWRFTETKRYFADHVMLYRWSAEQGDLVRISEWIPIVLE